MNQPTILLVMTAHRDTQRISEALATLGYPYPIYAPNGEAAINWFSTHRCDIAIIDYALPGIDGLETLVRLHQRQPELPIVMISGAKSEEVAVAAFRAGVDDYVPKDRSYAEVVAQRVQQLLLAREANVIAPPPAAREDIPALLLRLTYQNRLRAIGRQIDLYGYHSVHLLEVGGGFVARVLPAEGRTPEALEFPDRDFPLLMAGAFDVRGERELKRPRSTSPLLPTGYEDFFRALGHRLDQQRAEAITVTDLDSLVAVGGVAQVEQRNATTFAPLRVLLRQEDIAQLLDEAVQRRATPARRSSGLNWLRAQRSS